MKTEAVEAQKLKVKKLLQVCERNNMDSLFDFINSQGFFTSPASTKFHGCYEGGLAEHSCEVLTRLEELNKDLNLEIPVPTMIIASLLHDLCKMGAYRGEFPNYTWNHNHPQGHARLSLKWVQNYIELSTLEREMILYHMGPFGTTEMFPKFGEYSVKEWTNACDGSRTVKAIYLADEMASIKFRKI